MVIEDENPYLLLTPGPLSTTPTVKRVMMRDWCTWDDDYNVDVVQVIRKQLVELAGGTTDNMTAVVKLLDRAKLNALTESDVL